MVTHTLPGQAMGHCLPPLQSTQCLNHVVTVDRGGMGMPLGECRWESIPWSLWWALRELGRYHHYHCRHHTRKSCVCDPSDRQPHSRQQRQAEIMLPLSVIRTASCELDQTCNLRCFREEGAAPPRPMPHPAPPNTPSLHPCPTPPKTDVHSPHNEKNEEEKEKEEY
ncbi:hypothetical protein E2C01_042268 [Portunus trituberculatus]|uniref:Uncharacterized protein n=1 Tax=Portunus trituberculatus TaxID=210409 RepID=A0A5B7FT67_PORTR|nr:hypothetical protein [Portunus trituberculatus]